MHHTEGQLGKFLWTIDQCAGRNGLADAMAVQEMMGVTKEELEELIKLGKSRGQVRPHCDDWELIERL